MPTTAVLSCVDPNISLDQLLNSILVKLDDGTTGLRYIEVDAAAATINEHPECGAPGLAPEQIFRRAFGLTATGKTALVLIRET